MVDWAYTRRPDYDAFLTNANVPTSPTRSVSVLVVDDNQELAFILREVLVLTGNTVTTTNCPSAALSIASRLDPQVCILDVGLPEMDGYQLGYKLKAILPTATFVGHSAWKQDEQRQKEVGFAFDFYATKPMDMKFIINLLKSISQVGDPAGSSLVIKFDPNKQVLDKLP